jgi:hypothetical protein
VSACLSLSPYQPRSCTAVAEASSQPWVKSSRSSLRPLRSTTPSHQHLNTRPPPLQSTYWACCLCRGGSRRPWVDAALRCLPIRGASSSLGRCCCSDASPSPGPAGLQVEVSSEHHDPISPHTGSQRTEKSDVTLLNTPPKPQRQFLLRPNEPIRARTRAPRS